MRIARGFNSKINILSAISSKIRLYEIFFQGFDTFISSSMIVLFFSLKNCFLYFYNSLIQNNHYQQNGLIYLESCICFIELVCFINNKGAILNLVNSILSINSSFFRNNFAGNQNVNDILIENERNILKTQYNISCFKSIFENSQGLSFSAEFNNEISINNCYFIGLSLNISQGISIKNCVGICY